MRNPKKSRLKSLLFVVIQFISLGLIAVTGAIIPANDFLLAVEIFGIGLGVWAILSMRIGNFNITPDPLAWSKLVTSGPYGLIRHPMYLSLLVTTLPLIINSFSSVRLLIWTILLLDLLFKLDYEEGLLIAEVDGYEEYVKKSYRLIPFVY